MTTKNEELVLLLNDLVKINMDRIEGYKKAAEQTRKNNLLKIMFEEKALHSGKFVGELKHCIAEICYEDSNLESTTGKIYRGWLDIKTAFEPIGTPTILDSCEYNEKTVLKAYELALLFETDSFKDVFNKITKQKEGIQASYDQIKTIRKSLNKIAL